MQFQLCVCECKKCVPLSMRACMRMHKYIHMFDAFELLDAVSQSAYSLLSAVCGDTVTVERTLELHRSIAGAIGNHDHSSR